MQKIDHTTAERLRDMLSRIQGEILTAEDISVVTSHRVIASVSAAGFGLIDELEGVVR